MDPSQARFESLPRRLLVVCFLGAALASEITGALAETGIRADSASVARGASLYEAHCVSCHRQGGVGEPEVPWSIRRPDLVEAMPLDESSHAWHHGDEQLVTVILDGTQRSRRRMPVFRDILTEHDAADLIGYIKTFWSNRILTCQGPAHMRCM